MGQQEERVQAEEEVKRPLQERLTLVVVTEEEKEKEEQETCLAEAATPEPVVRSLAAASS
jgi:hypothetical protein